MATYYAIGSGNWTWTSANTANWSLSSGGSTAGAAPTASDTVIFDSHSTTGTVTWSTGVCASLSCIAGTGNFAGTIAGSTAKTLSGSFNLAPSSSMTFSVTATLTFSSTTSGNTVTCGGNSLPSLTFNGVGGVWTLQDTLTLQSLKTLTLTNGDLECNGQTLNLPLFSSSSSNTRTMTITNSTVNLSGTGTIWTFSTNTGLTFNSTGSIINITDTSAATKTFAGGNTTTYNNINITGGSNLGLVSLNTTMVVNGTLSVTGTNPFNIGIQSAPTFANLSLAGNSSTQSTFASTIAGTLRTVILTNATTVPYTTFQDITMQPAHAYIDATTGGINNGDNRGIIFSTGPYCLQVTSNSNASSSTTLAVTWNHTVTNGSLIVVGLTLASGTVTSVTDAKGNTYYQAATVNNGAGNTYLYYAYNVTGGTTDVVTAHLSGSGLVLELLVREYGGMATASPLDQTGTATGTSGPISVTTTGSTAQAVELVLALGSSFTSTDVMTVGSGYFNFQSAATQVTAQAAAEEVFTTTTGQQTATIANSVTSTWSGIIATFYVASVVQQLSALGVG